MKRLNRLLTLAALLGGAALSGCGGGSSSAEEPAGTPFVFDLPTGFPQPRISEDNPITVEKVALGRHLFYDNRMSANQAGSCGSCHEQRLAFSDGRARAIGPTGGVHPRNSMSLTNAVYNSRQNWANPTLRNLEQQAIAVMFAENPVELGWSGREEEILARFSSDTRYQELFEAAFPNLSDEDRYSFVTVADAIASFVATMISGRSAFDTGTMSDAARRGEELFNSERLECFHCHGAFNFAQSVQGDHTSIDTAEFKNNGLYNIDGPRDGFPLERGNYPTGNDGLYGFTLTPSDMGRFRPPTLRNIALTAPYMHDGSMATLEEVIVDHYAVGGRTISAGPFAGNGSQNPFKDPLIQGFVLTDNELNDLLQFFEALTDWDFVCNPDFSDPFGNIPMHEICP